MSEISRVIKIFNYQKSGDKNVDPDDDISLDKVGSKLADQISKKVIVGVLFMLITIPMLSAEPISVQSLESTVFLLDEIQSLGNATIFNRTMNTILDEMNDPKLIFFSFKHVVYLDELNEHKSLRRDEILTEPIINPKNPVLDRYDIPWKATFNGKKAKTQEATCTIIMTTLVVCLFAVGTLVLMGDSSKFVVKPLSRTIKIITNLARSVFWLTAKNQNWTPEQADAIEMDLIHGILLKIGVIFKSIPPRAEKDDNILDGVLATSTNTAYHIRHPGQEIHIKKAEQFWSDDESSDDVHNEFVSAQSSPKASISLREANEDILKKYESYYEDTYGSQSNQNSAEKIENTKPRICSKGPQISVHFADQKKICDAPPARKTVLGFVLDRTKTNLEREKSESNSS